MDEIENEFPHLALGCSIVLEKLLNKNVMIYVCLGKIL